MTEPFQRFLDGYFASNGMPKDRDDFVQALAYTWMKSREQMRIVNLTRAELVDTLKDICLVFDERDLPNRLYEVRFAIDDGLKVKVNNLTWGPPIGKVE